MDDAMKIPERWAAFNLIVWEKELRDQDPEDGATYIRPGMLFRVGGELLRIRHDPAAPLQALREDVVRVLEHEADALVVLDDSATAGAVLLGIDTPLSVYADLEKEAFANRLNESWSWPEAFKRCLVDVLTRD